jgi:hypothetical protein
VEETERWELWTEVRPRTRSRVRLGRDVGKVLLVEVEAAVAVAVADDDDDDDDELVGGAGGAF